MKTPQNRFAAEALPQTPLGERTTLPQTSLVDWGEDTAPNCSPLDAFDCCSWTFVGTRSKDKHPEFLKRGKLVLYKHACNQLRRTVA